MSRAVDDGVSIADLPRAIFVAGLMRPDDDTGTTYRFRLTTFNIETAPAHVRPPPPFLRLVGQSFLAGGVVIF